MYGLLTNPWVILATLIGLAASHGVVYYKGYESRDNKAKIELLKETEAKLKAIKAYEDVSREYVKAFHNKQTQTKIVYRTIKEKVKDETRGNVCFNDGASRLWDSSLQGSLLSESPSRTTEETTRTYSDEEVLNNAVQNFEQYTECRQQLNALIDWHENN